MKRSTMKKNLMNKKRILFLMPSMGKGGAEKVLINLLNVIDREKFEIDLCVVKKTGVYLEQVPADINVIILVRFLFLGRVFTYLQKRFNIQFFYRSLVNMRLKKQYDVAVSYSDSSYTELLTYLPKKPNRLICWVHASYASYSNYMKYYTPKYVSKVIKNRYSKMDTIVFASRDAEKDFVSIFGKFKSTRVIYNVLDVNSVIGKSKDVKAIVPWVAKKDVVSVVAMGSLFPVKGYDMLIKACRTLKSQGLKFHLTILGDGYLRQDLERLVTESDLGDTVALAGFVKNPYASVAAADIYVMSSHSEALPTALCEAMILGKPVVATDCNGCNEIIKKGMYGVQVKRNSESISAGLRYLIKDENQRRRYSMLSLERAKDFRDDEVLKKIEDLLYGDVQTEESKLLMLNAFSSIKSNGKIAEKS